MKCHQIIQIAVLVHNDIDKDFFSVVEVFLSLNVGVFGGWNIILRGRIDVVTFDLKNNSVAIDEIKTTSTSPDSIAVDEFWELQVLFYSYLFKNIDTNFLKKQENMSSLPKKLNIDRVRDKINPKLIVVQTLTGIREEFGLEYNELDIKNKQLSGLNKIIQFFLQRINQFQHFRVLQVIPWFFDEFRAGQEENLQIIRNGLSNPIAMLIGPPGTGKTALTLRILIERAITYQKQIMYTSTKNSQQLEVLHLIKLINVQLREPLCAIF